MGVAMDLIHKLGEVAKALTFIFGAAVLAVLLVSPGLFGARLHGTLRALEEAGLEVRFAAAGLSAQIERLQEVTEDNDAEVLELRRRLAEAEAALAAARGDGVDAAPAPPPDEPAVLGEPGPDVPDEPVVMVPDEPLVIVEEPVPPPWIVIAGAERDRASQMAEVQRLRSAGFEAELYLADGWYHAGVVYDGREAARDRVAPIAEVVGARRAPYPRALDVFCPAPDRSDPDLVICRG
jgi:hypothetical protein